MPVIPVLIGFAVSEVAGAAIAGAVASLGFTGVSASIASGAIIGGLSGGISAGVTGGNVGRGVIGGAVTGGVFGGVTSAVSSALGGAGVVGDFGPQIPVKPSLGGFESLGAGVSRGLGGLAGGTVGALAMGQPLNSALKSGLISGVGGGLGAGFGEALDLGKYGTGALGGALSYGLGKALQPTGQSQQTYVPNQTVSRGVSGVQSPGSQATGTSSALGSALFSAPGMSYSPGGPVLGGSGGDDKAPKNVWSDTDKSLRDVGSTVT
ncbi:hypothetical protein UFOVP937_3 [uncultured Caudovirales phage]|uniref:Uncharacterized protein n=1 Tax=uncultured Caudovirales phage TaxID=2100421 RepID=A0A6J5SJF8_9CAUD|nr:hypothetical protein UFOVP937_3 [uncultured Caudovirales phage]CAB4214436.1 hypothetical protein UFOVP1465_42 [uncultured Caudovirales phage]